MPKKQQGSKFPEILERRTDSLLKLDPLYLLLSFKKIMSPSEVETILNDFGLVLVRFDNKKNKLKLIVNHTNRRFWVRSRDGLSINAEAVTQIEEKIKSKLEWIGPVYRAANTRGISGLFCPLPNVLLIRLTENKIEGSIIDRLHGLGLQENKEKSKYLNGKKYYIIQDLKKNNSYQIKAALDKEKLLIQEIYFENMPMILPYGLEPNDTLYPNQWDMTRIQAGGPMTTGWDISTGENSVIICILDSGVDLTHPDLETNFVAGIDLDTMAPGGGPFGDPNGKPHGTCCAGIAAAVFNNSLGTSGVAGNCKIMPLSLHNVTDAEVAAGINHAADNGAKVISMSFGAYLAQEIPPGGFEYGASPSGWDFAIIDPAISHAFNDSGCVLCAITGNENVNSFNRYPGRHPLVIACGASDQTDNRKSPSSPDGENWWGSNYADGVSVVAPGVLIPSTDIQGTDGWNTSPGIAGNYYPIFNGTSAATPHVAGLAALLLSKYPSLSNIDVRNIIERTADKVGVPLYSDMTGFANGTRNQEMGYGRINVYHALDFAGMMIRDWPGDTGIEPSTPPGGNFWDFSDAVVKIIDNDVFVPDDPLESSRVERYHTNYIYVRVTNNGPQEARNVVVNATITPFISTEFIYPTDWNTVDPNHVHPTPISASFLSIPAGSFKTAKFTVSPAQVEELWGWEHGMNWHPCLLASVTADNDYAFSSTSLSSGTHTVRLNNLAQRNLSTIETFLGASVLFPFISGHRENSDTIMELLIDRSGIPKNVQLLLSLDDDGSTFPLVDFTSYKSERNDGRKQGTVFLHKTKLMTNLGCYQGVLTLEKGSRFDILDSTIIRKINVRGGKILLEDGRRFVEIMEPVTSITLEKDPNIIYPMSLRLTLPTTAEKDDQYKISIIQRNKKEETVGGATVIYSVREKPDE